MMSMWTCCELLHALLGCTAVWLAEIGVLPVLSCRQAVRPRLTLPPTQHLLCCAGDPEYEPQVPEMPAEPRRFRNPEMPAQARVEKPTKAEKRASAHAILSCLTPIDYASCKVMMTGFL